MNEVQIKIEVQDSGGNIQKRATLAVPEDITRDELLGALSNKYSKLVDNRSSVLVEWPSNKQATDRFVTDGATVIVRPRTTGIRFLNEE